MALQQQRSHTRVLPKMSEVAEFLKSLSLGRSPKDIYNKVRNLYKYK